VGDGLEGKAVTIRISDVPWEMHFLIRNRRIQALAVTVESDVTISGNLESFLDIDDRKKAESAKAALIDELRAAMKKVDLLQGLLPICAGCKSIRDDNGYWNHLETYISEHSAAEFSHGLCPDCAEKLYPEQYNKVMARKKAD